MPSLTVTDARTRAEAVAVTAYAVELDLTRGEDAFGSRTWVEFESRDGKDTWVDIRPDRLLGASLNDRALDVTGLHDGRLWLTGLEDHNVLVVDAVMAYSHDGEGLHRAVDTEDGRAYLYAMTFLSAAPRVFACFDQPDLKAPYSMRVKAPADWTVLGNGRAAQVEPGVWTLAQTKPLSTYLVTLVAGPYHSLTQTHDGITLGLHCRQSLAPHLDKDADELFRVTGRCFDEYHRLFGIRYPFGDYHQAFVPEFNAGAMENPGCVTLSDDLVFKAQATDSLRATRTNVIAHEMAHQWFGDLVTMTWWDDLWLNESFAEYMGYRVTSTVTASDDGWVEYALVTKAGGIAADQRRSTHPVAGNGAHDAQQALAAFDAISYSKGSSALRQLNAYLGDEAFLGGVVDHLRRHAYGNATLADLLGSWQRFSDADVETWAEAWLRTAGIDTLSAVVDRDGGLGVERESGSGQQVRRPHAFTLTWYDDDGSPTSTRVEATGDLTAVDLPSHDGSGLLLPDSGDETWAKIRLDTTSTRRASTILGAIGDPLARAVVWGTLREGLNDALLDPDRYLATVETVLWRESDLAVEKILGSSIQRVGTYLSADSDRDRLAKVAETLLRDAPPASNRQLVAARAFVALTDETDLLLRWLAGGTPDGLVADEDLRWRLTRSLCELGAFTLSDVEAERRRDPSSQGVEHALRCKAVIPNPATKAEVWKAVTTDASLSNYHLYDLAEYFFRPGQRELTQPYVARYFAEMPGTATIRTGWVLELSARVAFPRFAVDAQTVRLGEGCLLADDVDIGIRRAVSDCTDDLRRALASRLAYPRDRVTVAGHG